MNTGDPVAAPTAGDPSEPSSEPSSSDAESRLRHTAVALQVSERRQDGRTSSIGPRAERTRRRLIDSASRLFAERGYVGTSVSDIAEDAGVSLATFYQYFAERNDIVAVLVVEVIDEMLAKGVDRWDARSGRLGLRRVISPYVESYDRHRDFFELWQCVTHVDRRMRQLYRDYHGAYQHRFAKYLAEGVELGLVRADLEPEGMARAMTLLMERYCYEVFVLDRPDPAPAHDDVTDLLTILWADAIGLEETRERPRRVTEPMD